MLNRHAGSVLGNKLIPDRCMVRGELSSVDATLGGDPAVAESKSTDHEGVTTAYSRRALRSGLLRACFLRLAEWWLVEGLMATIITGAA